MKPTLVNIDSRFVVVTYWWGKGNLNKNTQRPCPEDMTKDSRITRKPISYDQMIKNWIASCRKANCNYMAVEFPEFAKKGGYQTAINYKPQFILDALKACAPRAVLYIDGDMHVKRYPRIFDFQNVDFMSQGWQTDPRYKMIWEGFSKCYYPYVFETSGGTMYFNQTPSAKMILREWDRSVKKHPLKAEDRLLSQIFNNQQLLLPTTLIQLPVEYLWLSIDYDQLSKNVWSRRQIFITHPECLTGEDRAFAGGAARNRFPARYTSQVSDLVKCSLRKMPFWEYIYFPSAADVSTMKRILTLLHQEKLIYLVPYSKKYGAYNNIAEQNKKLQKDIKFQKSKNKIIYISTKAGAHKDAHIIKNRELIPATIGYLERGHDVIYVPGTASKKSLQQVKRNDLSLVCRNTNTRTLRYKKEFTLVVDRNYPIFFGSDSEILRHLLYMCSSLAQIGRLFSRSYIFPSRIRCKWV
jgi:hypothetical protein